MCGEVRTSFLLREYSEAGILGFVSLRIQYQRLFFLILFYKNKSRSLIFIFSIFHKKMEHLNNINNDNLSFITLEPNIRVQLSSTLETDSYLTPALATIPSEWRPYSATETWGAASETAAENSGHAGTTEVVGNVALKTAAEGGGDPSKLPAVRAAVVLAYALLFVGGTVGNLLVLLVLACFRTMRSVTNLFIGNLALTDLMVRATYSYRRTLYSYYSIDMYVCTVVYSVLVHEITGSLALLIYLSTRNFIIFFSVLYSVMFVAVSARGATHAAAALHRPMGLRRIRLPRAAYGVHAYCKITLDEYEPLNTKTV